MMKYNCMNYKNILSLIVMATMLMSMRPSSDNFDFPKAWKEVEKLVQDNLPQSVIDKVEEISVAAENEDNRPQQIKANSYVASYKLRTEENGLDQAILYLQDKIKQSNSDEVEAINRVVLADFYQQYLLNNGYRISDRTTSDAEVSDDYKTWSQNTWVDKITEQYDLALIEAKILDIPVGEYADILIQNEKDRADYDKLGEEYIPTLYVLFAEKSIQSFRNIRQYAAKGINAFAITDDSYYTDGNSFTNIEIGNETISQKILVTYQKLVKHTKKKNISAFARQDFNSLKAVKELATYTDSKNDFVLALKRLADSSRSTEFYSSIMIEIAHQQMAPATKDGNVIAIQTCEEAIKIYRRCTERS